MPRPTPEQLAREVIGRQLRASGWRVQSVPELNLAAGRGVAVRELQSQGGPADSSLFVDGRALGVVEAKREGTTLSTVAEQSARYTAAKNWIPQRWADPLQSVDSDEGVPLAVARKAFGGDPKDIIEELNSLLVA